MQPRRQRPRNQLSLVVTAFALPIRVQRDRHRHVRAQRLTFTRHNLRQTRREPIAQPRHFFIVQQPDRVVQRVVVHAITTCPIERILAIAAQPAARLRSFGTRRKASCTDSCHRREKRPRATFAPRLLDRRERCRT